MNVLVVRHAIAEQRDEFSRTGKSDDERPLTQKGKRRMERAAAALAELVPDLDLIAASPLVRTMETAAILAEACGASVEELKSLAPDGSRAGTIRWLGSHADLRSVALVGHEPTLSALACTMLCATCQPFLEFKKGGAMLVAFDGKPASGRARLVWSIPPSALRALAGARKR